MCFKKITPWISPRREELGGKMHWLQSLIYYIQCEGRDIVHHEKGSENIFHLMILSETFSAVDIFVRCDSTYPGNPGQWVSE